MRHYTPIKTFRFEWSFYLRRLLFFASSMSFFASNRFLSFSSLIAARLSSFLFLPYKYFIN